MLNLAWIFAWDRSSVKGSDNLTILAFFLLLSIVISNIAVRLLTMAMIIKILQRSHNSCIFYPSLLSIVLSNIAVRMMMTHLMKIWMMIQNIARSTQRTQGIEFIS